MSTFNQNYTQSGDGNLSEPVHVGRSGQQVVFSSVIPENSYAVKYPTLESIPADFVGTVDVVTPTYKATVKGDGTNKFTTGSSDLLSSAPSPAVIGIGTWRVGAIIYNSDGYRLVDYSDQISPAAGAQVFDSTPISVIPLTGALSVTNSALTISGYGALFNTTDGLSFSHLLVRRFGQVTAVPSDFWQTITINVRAGSQSGAIVATGSYSTTPYAASYNDVLFELSSGGVPKTVKDTDLGLTYFIEYYATNRDGGRAPIGLSASTIPASNQVLPGNGNAWFQLTSTGAWTKTVGAGASTYYLAVEPYNYSDKLVIPASSQISNELLLPPIYAVVGRECNVYFDGLTSEHYDKLGWDVTCAIGTQQNERFTVIPDTASASVPLTISALDPATLATVATKVSDIKVAAAAAAGTLNCLFIGDSTTASGEVVTEVNVLDTADANIALTMLGTQGSGANLHEGRAGWTSTMFVETGSPFFVGGKIDFAGYMTANGYTGVDRVIINLGINDVFSATSDAAAKVSADTYISNIGKLITSIQSYSATCIIGIAATTPPSYTQDAFGKNYASGQTYWRYKRNISILYSKIIAKFSGLTASKIWILPYNVSLDTVNNMITETVAVNSRNSATVVRQANGVHPALVGYLQIADAAYAWIKCTL